MPLKQHQQQNGDVFRLNESHVAHCQKKCAQKNSPKMKFWNERCAKIVCEWCEW